MKVSEMIKNLQEFLDENGDLECWYASDDVGSDYYKIEYKPCLYYANKDGKVYNSIQDFDFNKEYVDDIQQICVVN